MYGALDEVQTRVLPQSLSEKIVEQASSLSQRNTSYGSSQGQECYRQAACLPHYFFQTGSAAITKKLALFDDARDSRRDHSFPAAVTGLDFRQHVRRKDGQIVGSVIANRLNEIVLY